MYASSHSMPNLSVTIHPPTKSWSNGPSESDSDVAASTAAAASSLSQPIVFIEKQKEANGGGYNAFGSSASLSPPDPLNAKKLSELDNLLFPRIQDKHDRSPSVASFADKSVEQLNKERMKNKKTLLSHYFEDGKRRVDYVIVFTKPTTTNPKSEEMLHFEQRSIFEVRFLDLKE